MRLSELSESQDLFPNNSRIVEVLKTLSWDINIRIKTGHVVGGTYDFSALIQKLKRNGIRRVDADAIVLIANTSRYQQTEHFETLHEIWHPDLDKPKPEALDGGFHDEDEFQDDGGPELLGYEFMVGYYSADDHKEPPTVNITAHVFDTTEAVEPPIPVVAWMQGFFKQTLDTINQQLV